jgi:DNA repair protein RadA/Sms
MATRVAPFRCTSCAHESPRWFGRCPSCGDWSTAEAPLAAVRGPAPALATLAAPGAPSPRIGSGNDEVDRVLGGGFVPGEVALLAGDVARLRVRAAALRGGHELDEVVDHHAAS